MDDEIRLGRAYTLLSQDNFFFVHQENGYEIVFYVVSKINWDDINTGFSWSDMTAQVGQALFDGFQQLYYQYAKILCIPVDEYMECRVNPHIMALYLSLDGELAGLIQPFKDDEKTEGEWKFLLQIIEDRDRLYLFDTAIEAYLYFLKRYDVWFAARDTIADEKLFEQTTNLLLYVAGYIIPNISFFFRM